jgi:choline monooxygenase
MLKDPIGNLQTTAGLGVELTHRALDLVRSGTTELAPDTLTVPLGHYRDPQIAERERELLRRTPLALVATSQVPDAHDYAVRTVLGTSVLVSRGEDGTARAFLNYCRHRGARPAEGCGRARRFVCPYHAWSYDSCGRLAKVPGDEGFAGLDRDAYGLVELPSEERHGFVWVVLTRDGALDLDDHLGSLDAELARWEYPTYTYLTEREIEGDVSWKAALEAFMESYHIPFVHRKSVIGQNTVGNTSIQDAFGRHQRVGLPLTWIADLDEHPERSWDPVDNIALIYWVFPNLVLANSALGVEILEILPDGADPLRCRVRHGWMSRGPIADDAAHASFLDLYEEVHAAVRDEDFVVLPTCGDGIRNGQHDHMVIGRNEIGVQHLVRELSAALGGELAPGS